MTTICVELNMLREESREDLGKSCSAYISTLLFCYRLLEGFWQDDYGTWTFESHRLQVFAQINMSIKQADRNTGP